VAARSNRVDDTSLEYIGYNREAQGLWINPFFFAYLTEPLFGYQSCLKTKSEQNNLTENIEDCEEEMTSLRAAISAINKIRPRFVVISGSFVSTGSISHPSLSSTVNDQNKRQHQVESFRRTVARISETIPILFVPGEADVGIYIYT
jgi:hypothetical protein